MRSNKTFKPARQTYAFMAIQLLIMLAALLSWLFHRGNLFQQSFTLDEYIVTENTVVVEDVTTDETMNGGGSFMHSILGNIRKIKGKLVYFDQQTSFIKQYTSSAET